MRRLLIVDDEESIIDIIRVYFEDKGFEVIGAKNLVEARNGLLEHPDIILLDIMMKGMDGITFCQDNREKVPCPILFLTARVGEKNLVSALAVGGDDYITKPFCMAELYARVEAHLRREGRRRNHTGRIFFQSDKRKAELYPAAFWIDYGRKEVGYGDSCINLTRKEYLIVELLSSYSGQIFAQEQIYEKVWGYEAEGDANTAVTEYIKRIRKKLAVDGRTDWIETVWGIGYRWKR